MNEFDYLAKAAAKLEDEQYDEVISLCDKALKINDKLSDAYNIRGNANYYLANYDKASCDYNKAIEISPYKSDYYYDRSCLNLQTNNYENAIVDIIKAIELEPKNSLYYYEKGVLEINLKRYLEAITTFTYTIKTEPTENEYLKRAYCYIELEEYDKAFDDLNSALEINPESSSAYYYKGYIKRNLENYKDAISDLEKAFELNPLDDDALIEIGKCKAEMGKLDGALKYINKAIKLNPTEQNHKTRVLAREKVLKIRQNIVNLYKNKPVSDIKKYEVEIFNKKQAQDDIKDLNKILEFSPDNVDVMLCKMKRYFYLEDYSNALKDCEKILDNKNLDIEEILDTLTFKGICEFKLSNFIKSIEDLSKVLAFNKDSKSYYYRALANYNLKHFILSYKDFKKALELNTEIEAEIDFKIPMIIKKFLNYKNNKISKNGDKQAIGLYGLKNN